MRRNVSSQAMLLMRGIHNTLFFSRAGRVSDLAAAQIVADHIGTIHHEIKFNQEGLDAIRDVIYNLETLTTIGLTPNVVDGESY
jgi:asparagine synthetase B (glutamine-hydrolysing)